MRETSEPPITGPVLVTGGTGTLGRLVVTRLREAGREVRVLSRHAPERATPGVEHIPGDLVTGEGVDRAVEGAGVIVHCAGNAKGDEAMTRTLVQAIQRLRAGDGVSAEAASESATAHRAPHLVYISVVGADRVTVRSRIDRAAFGYFAAKLAAERVVAGSGLPHSILRATQFHDLALTTVQQLAKLPVVVSFAGVRFQPIDASEVADRLVDIALGEPIGMAPEMGGPRIFPMEEMVRSYLRAAGRRRPVLRMRMPGAAYRAVRDGALLTPEHAAGGRTWEEFLADRLR